MKPGKFRAVRGVVGRATIVAMILARLAMKVAEGLFLFGLAGSAIVVIITFVEDLKELFGQE